MTPLVLRDSKGLRVEVRGSEIVWKFRIVNFAAYFFMVLICGFAAIGIIGAFHVVYRAWTDVLLAVLLFGTWFSGCAALGWLLLRGYSPVSVSAIVGESVAVRQVPFPQRWFTWGQVEVIEVTSNSSPDFDNAAVALRVRMTHGRHHRVMLWWVAGRNISEVREQAKEVADFAADRLLLPVVVLEHGER